jgi:hypothetical protein
MDVVHGPPVALEALWAHLDERVAVTVGLNPADPAGVWLVSLTPTLSERVTRPVPPLRARSEEGPGQPTKPAPYSRPWEAVRFPLALL